MRSITAYEIRPSMHILRRRTRPQSRGQAMVEFAIILPVLALLLVMAIDFGRVFFGWVGVHNAARIAANAAASDPDAWEPPGQAGGKNAYRLAVLNDLRSLNCTPPASLDADGDGAWDLTEIPDPVFENRSTSFSAALYEVGDQAVATIPCSFQVITPLAGAIVGNPVDIVATAEFMVRSGVINGIPTGPAPPPASCVDKVVPNLVGMSVAAARTAWANAGFTGAFSPATGSDTDIVTAQTTTPSSSPNDCLVSTASVVVTHAPSTACTAPDVSVPNLVGLTVDQARSTWSADFTGTFTPATGSGTDTVDGQTTNPASSPGDCVDPATDVTVTHSAPPPTTCTMPQLVGLNVNAGQSAFTTAGFTGSYTANSPPGGNYQIKSQSLTFGQDYACTADVVVAGN